jgi:hypothetical protein
MRSRIERDGELPAWMAIAGAAIVAAACGGDKSGTATATFTVEQLQDPATCNKCHQTHYKEWSGSMHAYASKDPVFRAMDARGQRETANDPAGPLGGFCVKCHAPMAYLKDPNTVGADLDTLPDSMQGITCYFCHQVKDVTDTHNNPLVLANDTTMRGEYNDPVANKAHQSTYSELHDADGYYTTSGNGLTSSKLCGSCHDIVVPAHFSGASQDVALERTYTEWQGSIFNQTGKLNSPNACGSVGCHTRPTDFNTNYNGVPIADAVLNPGVKARAYLHPHGFPGVDLALTDFPERDAQRRSVQTMLNTTLLVTLCVADVENVIGVELENSSVGHNIPSGASQDRRMWLEVKGYKSGQQIYASGLVPPGHSPAELLDKTSPFYDANFASSCTDSTNATVKCDLLRDTPIDKNGNPVHMFWQAADVPAGNRQTMAVPVTNNNSDPRYHMVGDVASWIYRTPARPDRVTLTIHVQPMGIDVLQDLMRTHDLLPSALLGGVDLPDAGLLDAGHTDGGTGFSGEAFRNAMPTLAVLPNTSIDDAGVPPTDAVTLEWNPDTIVSMGDANAALNGSGPPASCVYTAKRPK